MTELKAGRELDALIAEKVMGLTGRRVVYAWVDRKVRAYPKIAFDLSKNWDAAENSFATFIEADGSKVRRGISFALPYSTDIAAAWKVLTKMAVPGHRVTLAASGAGTFDVEWTLIDDDDICLAEECDVESAPLAICLAALSSFPDSTKEGE